MVNQQINSHISERHYLADAEFILAIDGERSVIDELSDAVRHPVFSPFLGRQAFAPQFPFHLGIREGDGVTVLEHLASTAPSASALRVYQLGRGRPIQIARIDPPRTTTPLIAWKQL